MTAPACPSYAGYRFPAEIISRAVWLYFRAPLSLRMVDEPLAARGIIVSYETVRQWAQRFGQVFANQIRRSGPAAGGKWHLNEVVIAITEPPGPKPLRFGPRSLASPMQRSYEHAVLIARHRNLSSTS